MSPSSPPALEIRLLGRFEVKRNGELVRVPLHAAQLLLAYLAVKTGTPVKRRMLAGLFWPHTPDEGALRNFRGALSQLQKALGSKNFIAQEGDTLELDLMQDCVIDVRQFLTPKPTRLLSTDELIRVIELYEGEFMPGFYEEWVETERQDLQNKFEQRMETLLERLRDEKNWKSLREWGQTFLTRVDRTSEKAYRALILAHFHLGERAQMEAVYRQCEAALKKELEIEPSTDTKRLLEELRSKILPSELPPAPLPPSSAEPPFSAPTFATPCVGREAELAQIQQRLADPDCHLLTLTGLGGIGKTRLMTEALFPWRGRFAQGIFFVSLAAATSVEQMITTLADALKFNFYGKDPPRQQLIDYVREKQILLALDNLEQVEQAAEFLESLLSHAPQLKIIATARERLHLPQEWIFDVPGLSFPTQADARNLADYDAVKLCVLAAKRLANLTLTDEDLSHIARLTRLVGGMPLALEMAAAWLRALPVAEIAQQIEKNLSWLISAAPNVPERQHSLRAVFDYSWRLLNESEKRLFRRLAVFRGGFQRTAAEKVTQEPFSLFVSLMDKSLVRRVGDDRYELHGLLRQFAEEKLYASAVEGERPAEVEAKFAHYFLEYAGLHQHHYDRFELEWDNLHAAIRAAHRNQLWAVVLGLTESLSEAWLASNHLTEARQMYALAQTAALALNHPRGLARVQNHWGRACVEQNDYAEGKLHLAEALEISRAENDAAGMAQASYQLGYCAVEEAEWGEAERLLTVCQDLYAQLGNQLGLAEAIFEQARVCYHRDQLAEAIRLATQALDIQTTFRQENNQIRVLRLLANSCVEQRFNEPRAEAALLEQGWAYCQQALKLCEQTQNQDELALVMRSLASIAKLRGDVDSALKYVRRSLALQKHKGNRRDQSIALYELGMIYIKARQYALALEASQQSLQLCQQLQDAFGEVYISTTIGDAYHGLGEPARACEIWRAALIQAKQFASPHPQISALQQRLQQNNCAP